MAKNSITDYDNTAANNTDVQSVDIAEGCSPSGINNAIREVMADLADVNDGTVALTSPSIGTSLDMNGNELILDADGDTSITADTDDQIDFKTGGSDRMHITSTGVGIGTTSPTADLTVSPANNEGAIRVGDNATYYGEIKRVQASDEVRIGSYGASQKLTLYTVGTERMRIDSSGNLLVGTTTTAVANGTTAGIALTSGNQLAIGASNDVTAYFNRISTDGEILEFRKDGSTVGSIGTGSGRLSIGGGDTGLEFTAALNAILPHNQGTNTNRDNAIDLGYSTVRFDDIYATNGTIQTSDENEKQQIASLTDAEITAAKAISKLFKTFKWNSSVTENGDNARTHTGVIAQHVQTAMTDAGLDAGNYAFFISTDWHEDADGNHVDADAEGAIAKNRKGIRYPELLSFIGAATEQRLADLETRVTALENA